MFGLKFSKKKVLVFLLSIFLIAGFFSFGHALRASATQTTQEALGLTQVAEGTGLGKEDIRTTIAKIIRVILGFLGIAALLVMLYGGFVYMTAGGNEQRVSMAKKIMINGAIGLVIIFSSFAITQFVLNKLAEGTNFAGVDLVPPACADPVYANDPLHQAECNPGGFTCDTLSGLFVVKSITPNTLAGTTGMNNIAIRVIFSQPLAVSITPDNVFVITRGGVNVNSEFSFDFVNGNRSIVEAHPAIVPPGVPLHDVPVAQGNYTVTVNTTLTSANGDSLDIGTTACGSFPNEAPFNVTPPDVIDNQAPTISTITYNGLSYGGTIALPRGRTYRIGAAIQDNSGAGYVRLQVQRYNMDSGAAIGGEFVLYDGPSTTRGSQATNASPYNFSYNYLISAVTPLYTDPENEHSYFHVILTATDIDHNQTIAESDFIVVNNVCAFGTGAGDIAAGCRGNGTCVGNAGCLSGLCDTTTGMCKNVPLITDVSPWSQAGGSWVTISGSGFGTTEGNIQFGRDDNNNGIPGEAADGGWITANVVSCNGSNTWHDNYVIVEVPLSTTDLPNLSLSSVRINHSAYLSDPGANPDFFDTTTDTRGPVPSVAFPGWFKKDDSLDLPGLCSVVNTEAGSLLLNTRSGLPGDSVVASGQKLGTGGTLAFGNIAAATGSWTDTTIDATVPSNMSPGNVGVVATVGGKQSNGILFKVASELELVAPIIESITPSSTTRGSYITISGQRFGDGPGVVYLAPTPTTDCSVPNACLVLNTALPAACGNTWNNEQIIGQVPANTPFGQRTVIVENLSALRSIPGTADRLNIVAGGPMPSICALSPVKGIAPLEAGSPGIKITGINFSANPKLYFWGMQSLANNNNTWLSLPGTMVAAGGIETVTTNIPVDFDGHSIPSQPTPFDSGFSMKSGPIKLVASAGTGLESNSVKYTVDDCRGIAQANWPATMVCCTEGPSTGNFIHQSFNCPGTTRTGGYVWRFTTGRIAQAPRVIESCDNSIISPTPWRYQGNGENICLNAEVTVDFTTNIQASSLTNNIRLFTAGTGIEPATISPTLVDISSTQLDISLVGQNLTIRSFADSGDLTPNTWYRVVLLNGIKSEETVSVLGVNTVFNRPLLRTRPCDIDLDGNGTLDKDLTTYCFDFKTGPVDSKCILESVGVKPDTYSVDTLGPVINGRTLDNLIYQVWGRGDQECSVMSVAGLGWNWTAIDTPPAVPVKTSVTVTQDLVKDYLATAVANQDPSPSTHVKINASATVNSQSLVGSSALYINLGPPKVTDYWPNCGSACINAVIGAKFNRMMNPATYAGNIHLYKCPSENDCILAVANKSVTGFSEVTVEILPEYASNRYEVQLALPDGVNLDMNTSYLVSFTGDIYSVGELAIDGPDPDTLPDPEPYIVQNGLPLEAKMWQFKTKTEGGFCIADKVVTAPDPFTSYFIGEKTRYTSSPVTNPDQCNPNGQLLNPWSFGWNWTSLDNNVATVSKFATPGKTKLACTQSCLYAGSDVIRKGGTNIVFDAEDDVNNPLNSIPWSNYTVNTEGSNHFYSITQPSTNIETPAFIPIDTAKTYKLSGLFRSAGSVSSRLYFGFAPYDKDKNFIHAYSVVRMGNDGIITAIAPGANQITVRDTLTGWVNFPSTVAVPAYAYQRSLGFYYDGDTTHLPDYVLVDYTDGYSTDPAQGAYSSAIGNTIVLNSLLPAAVLTKLQESLVAGVNPVVKNHMSGSAYIYNSASYSPVPISPFFTQYPLSSNTVITGAAFVEPGNTRPIYSYFYPGTKYVRLIMLTNYAQESSAGQLDLQFDKLTLNEIGQSCMEGEDCSGDVSNLWLCGNGILDPGEDCDIGMPVEVISTGCSLTCQRPGNINVGTGAEQCGNGAVDTNQGEECDTDDANTKIGCTANCTHAGSTTDPAQASAGQPLCGSGAITTGEDCEPGIGNEIAGVTCSANCLHLGTKIYQKWCDSNSSFASSNECQSAISVCGNGFFEKGEECEIIGGGVRVPNPVTGVSILTNAPSTSCTSRCLLKDICGTNVPTAAPTDFRCDPATEGCNLDCTFRGSSVNDYSSSSLCGDAVIGTGEYSQCEYTSGELDDLGVDLQNQNPIQVVTSVGEGTLDATTQSQNTQIVSTARSVLARGTEPEVVLTLTQQAQLTDSAKYTLQCGFKENNTTVAPFNDCPSSSNGLTQGVGSNSCCYTRPQRTLGATDYYPLDASGLSGGPAAACRNTAIFVTFDGDIDDTTLLNNFVLAKGYTAATGVDCGTPERNITTSIKATLAYNDQPLENQDGFWNNIWNSVKKIFAWFVGKAKASTVNDTVVGVGTWCKTDLAGVPEVLKVKDELGNVTKSIVHAYLPNLLEENTTYAVFMRGGTSGIKDVRGVGIKSPNPIVAPKLPHLDDSFVFRTGSDICKIGQVSISPSKHTFTVPKTDNTFVAFAKSTDGRFISPITGVYNWTWSWGPSTDAIFNIPNPPPATVPPTPGNVNTISSKDLEGKRIGHAFVTITTDISSQDSQVGQVITGDTDLSAVFCENPWPPVLNDAGDIVNYYPYEDGIAAGSTANNDGAVNGVFVGSEIPTVGGNYFNFKLSYCADAGSAGNKTDDLPYLRPFVFIDNFPDPNTLKKFLFFNDVNNDAIGIQIFSNPDRDSVAEWFRKKLGNPAGFRSVSIDGYEALTDGSNYYINALNNIPGTGVYYNIYLISINKEAQESTKKVFDKIIDSFEFNINLTDNKYCDGDATRSCSSNYDCVDRNGNPILPSTGTCSADKTKMRRDWQRIVILKDILDKLGNQTTVPALTSGTYIPGQTKSVWPSWGNFASQAGGGLGSDPLNKWTSCSYCSNSTGSPVTLCSSDEDCGAGNTCVTVDSQTCWDDINNRFICPKLRNVFSYKLDAGNVYKVYSPVEYFNAAQVNVFLGTGAAHFVLGDSALCSAPGTVVSPSTGVCGNGIINTGESCEPPGQTIVSSDSCDFDGGSNNGRIANVCNANCQLEAEDICQEAVDCGNARIEGSEKCDEGSLNGTYGHCNAACTGFSAQFCGNTTVDKSCSISGVDCSSTACAANVCSITSHTCSLSLRTCTDNIDCENNVCVPSEVCDLGSATNGRYNVSGSGCAEDCQSRGPRCGDGILQTAPTTPGATEECDDANSDPLDGCNNCTLAATSPALPGSTVSGNCGDGIVNNGEACDRGTDPVTNASNNGVPCVPGYGERCNYCSTDCGEVLYVEPVGFCGNRTIDVISSPPGGTPVLEACEYIPSIVVNGTVQGPWIKHPPLTSTSPEGTSTPVDHCRQIYGAWTEAQKKYTIQTGEYKCTNNCTGYVQSCDICGNALIAEGGTTARVSVLNPVVGLNKESGTVDPWFDSLFAKFYMRDIVNVANVINNVVNVPSSVLVDFSAVGATKNIFTVPANNGIFADQVCNDTYYMCFNQNGTSGNCLETAIPSKHLWTYPVKGEVSAVDNDYIVSPNPATGTVRIVLKWTDKDQTLLGSSGKLGLGIINTANGSKTYFNTTEANRCDKLTKNISTGYWGLDASCLSMRWPSTPAPITNQGMYLHKVFNTAHTYMQSMTINLYDSWKPVNGSFIENGPFAIFVEAQNSAGGMTIGGLTNSDAEILVYEHHELVPGDPAGSANIVFQPDYSFKIKNAKKSSNNAARFWHAFNIKRNDDSSGALLGTYYAYAIESAQTIRTDTAELVAGAYIPFFFYILPKFEFTP